MRRIACGWLPVKHHKHAPYSLRIVKANGSRNHVYGLRSELVWCANLFRGALISSKTSRWASSIVPIW